MSAPERIIADCGNVQSGTSDLCQWEHWGDLVEYNRADLCDPMQDERVKALQAENARLREALQDMVSLFSADNVLLKGTHLNATLELARAALRALGQG